MAHLFIDELREVHLCTYYVLPLLKLNKFSFLNSNLVNCYLTTDGISIVVQVVDRSLLSPALLNHDCYRGAYFDDQGHELLEYKIPARWRPDVLLFMAGKFSAMSDAAKNQIRCFSGLEYKERKGNQVFTDGRLLALDKHPVLRQMWERELTSITQYRNGKAAHRSVVELDEDTELLSIPGKESYISLNGLVRIV